MKNYKDVKRRGLAILLAVLTITFTLSDSLSAMAAELPVTENIVETTVPEEPAVEEPVQEEAVIEEPVQEEPVTEESNQFENLRAEMVWGDKIDRLYPYTGEEIEPVVRIMDGAEKELVEDTDYVLSYKNNVAITEDEKAQVIVSGIGEYEGYETTLEFTIIEPAIEMATFALDVPTPTAEVERIDINTVVEATLNEDYYTYDGSVHKPVIRFYNLKTGAEEESFKDNCTIEYPNSINAGDYEVRITGENNYEGEIILGYTIAKASFTRSVDIEVGKDETGKNQIIWYDGNPKTANVVVKKKDSGEILRENTDYTVKYSNNIDIGNMDIRITGKGNYYGSVDRSATIYGRFDKDAEVRVSTSGIARYNSNTQTYESSYTAYYTGKPISPSISVSINGEPLSKQQYSVAYTDAIEAGMAKCVVTTNGSAANGIYANKSFVVTFKILPRSISMGDLTVVSKDRIYTGGEITIPADERPLMVYGNNLMEGTDYDISYNNNINAGTASFTLTGKGNYSGTLHREFLIKPLELNKSNAFIRLDSNEPIEYTGEKLFPAAKLYYRGENAEGAPVDEELYELVYEKNTLVGTDATITAKTRTSNIKITGVELKFNIVGRKLNRLTFIVGGVEATPVLDNADSSKYVYRVDYSATYNGGAITPDLVIKDGDKLLEGINSSTATNTDYVYRSMNAVDVTSDAYLSVGILLANYEKNKEIEIYFNIAPKDINSKDIKVVANVAPNNVPWVAGGNVPQNVATITDSGKKLSYEMNQVSGQAKDYEVIAFAGENYAEAGAGKKAIIQGTGNYTGTRAVTFDYGTDITKLTPGLGFNEDRPISPVSGVYKVPYMLGSKPVVTFPSNKAVKYVATYYALDNSGDISSAGQKVRIDYAGDVTKGYYGRNSIQYEVVKAVLTRESTEIGGNSSEYTGNTIVPKLTVQFKPDLSTTVNLQEGRDYRVEIPKDFVQKGEYTVKVIGINNCEGSFEIPYTIGAKNADNFKIDPIAARTYTGSEIRPDLTIYDGNKRLVKDIDYTLEYRNCTNASKDDAPATVIVRWKNNYTGNDRIVSFVIEPKKISNLNALIDGIENDYLYYASTDPSVPSLSDAIVSKLVVTCEGMPLEKDKDYTLSAPAQLSLGQYTYNVAGKGNYSGAISRTITVRDSFDHAENFEIQSNRADDAKYVLDKDGRLDLSGISVYHKNPDGITKTLVSKDNYTINIDNCRKPGRGYMEIVGVDGSLCTGKMKKTIDVYGDLANAKINNVLPRYAYTGLPARMNPLVTFGIDADQLNRGADGDYILEESTRTEVGEAAITITANTTPGHYYQGSQTKKFSIQYDLRDAVITGVNTSYDFTTLPSNWNGVEVKIPKLGTNDFQKLEYLTDYTIEAVQDGTTGVVQILPVEGRSYNSAEATYGIVPISMGRHDNIDMDVTFDGRGMNDELSYVYAGEAIKPQVLAVCRRMEEGVIVKEALLKEGTDYRVTYSNNINVGTGATVTVEGIGYFKGKIGRTFVIEPKSVNSPDIGVEIKDTYFELLPKPEIIVKDGERVLTKNKDYTTYVEVTYSHTPVGPENVLPSVIITGRGNYVDATAKIPFNLLPRDIADCYNFELSSYETNYTGLKIDAPTLTLTTEYNCFYEDDYQVSYLNPAGEEITVNDFKEAGIYTIRATGKRWLTGSIERHFEVKAIDISDFEVEKIQDVLYNGAPHTPALSIKSKDDQFVLTGNDVVVTYTNNTNAGVATYKVEGKGNYTGTLEGTFKILANLSTATISNVEPGAFYLDTPSFTVSCGGRELLPDEYQVITDPENNQITIKASEDAPYYIGEKTFAYTFDKTANNLQVMVDGKLYDGTSTITYPYTGKNIAPKIELVTPKGKVIENAIVSYERNGVATTDLKNAGSMQARVSVALNDHEVIGREVLLEIAPMNLEDCRVETVLEMNYTGRDLEPEVYVFYNDKHVELEKGVDYTVEYSNNRNPGEAQIVFTGTRNVTGRANLTFQIVASGVSQLKGNPETINSVLLSWSNKSNVDGYEIYSGDGKKLYGTTTEGMYSVGGLQPGTVYEFKVRSYVYIDGIKQYGVFKSVRTNTRIPAVTLKEQSHGRNQISIAWNSIPCAEIYEVYRSTSKNGTYERVASLQSHTTYYTDTNVSVNKTYYYKVRVCKKFSGDGQYQSSAYSKTIGATAN